MIKIKINDREFELDEALELYYQLKKIFDQTEYKPKQLSSIEENSLHENVTYKNVNFKY
jgi:ABC-type bacteriocin/lantibiotic exporter with double-glycine peptidase domain